MSRRLLQLTDPVIHAAAVIQGWLETSVLKYVLALFYYIPEAGSILINTR